MEYPASLQTLRECDPALAEELAPLCGLEGVLGWIKRRGLPLASLDMVTQDEYSHDLLLPLGPGGRHLAFAVT
jgi:hypothetical protein